MRVSATILGCFAAATLTLTPAVAAPAKPSKPAKPTTAGRPATSGKPAHAFKPTTGAKPVKAPSVKPTAGTKPVKSPSVKPTAGTKSVKSPSVKPTTTGKPAKSSAMKPTAAKSKASTTRTATTTPSPIGSRTTTPLNPIAEKIASKPNLSAKLTRMLPVDPVTGKTMTLDKASLGFKNQGQFIAALHVSQNHGIPFTELKSHMVTVTPGAPGQPPTATQTGSLGGAIQASKTTVDTQTAVRRAEAQATTDLQTATADSTSPRARTKTTAGAR